MKYPSEQYLKVGHNIGKNLCRDALWAGDRCNWIGSVMEFQENQWQVVGRIPDGLRHRRFAPLLEYRAISQIAHP